MDRIGDERELESVDHDKRHADSLVRMYPCEIGKPLLVWCLEHVIECIGLKDILVVSGAQESR